MADYITQLLPKIESEPLKKQLKQTVQLPNEMRIVGGFSDAEKKAMPRVEKTGTMGLDEACAASISDSLMLVTALLPC